MEVRTILCDLVTFVTPLVDLIQDYDIHVHVAKLLDHWSPTSSTWPDQTRNPAVTRHLYDYHRADVVIPYLDGLFQQAAQLAHGPSGNYKVSSSHVTHDHIQEIYANVQNYQGAYGTTINARWPKPLHDIQQKIQFIIYFGAGIDVTALVPWFSTCPLFTVLVGRCCLRLNFI